MQLESRNSKLIVTAPDNTSVEVLQHLNDILNPQNDPLGTAWQVTATIPFWLAHIAEWAKDKGWWFDEADTGEQIALMHSELSEALECYRDHMVPHEVRYKVDRNGQLKPEGIGMELADCVIRIMHYCAQMGVPLDECIRLKMIFNQSRPERHGGKKV